MILIPEHFVPQESVSSEANLSAFSGLSGLGSPDASLLSPTMKTSLSITCAQSRVSVPAVCSRMPNLRAGKVAENVQRLNTGRVTPQRRRSCFGHGASKGIDEAHQVGSYRNHQRFCSTIGSHCVGVMPQDSSEAQCPKGEEHHEDEGRDEHAGEVLNLQSDNLEGGDNEGISSQVADKLTSEQVDSATVSRLPPSNDGRVEELAKVVKILRQSLLSISDQLETLGRHKETLNGYGKNTRVVESTMRREDFKPVGKIGSSVNGDRAGGDNGQESPRSRMESRKRIQKREAQRNLTSNSRIKREKLKLEDEEDVAATNRIREEDERYMGEALVEAKKAAMAGEIPVGAVIVQKGKIIARAYNRVESDGDPTAHAEMLCLRSAARHHGDWRLMDATLYVTLEPCPMCAGAILQSRVKGIVWGSRNTLLGADGSWVSLFPELVEEEMDLESPKSDSEPGNRPFTHPFHTSLEVRRQVLADECSIVMRSFFKARRTVTVHFLKTKPWWLPLSAWVLFKTLLHWLSSLVKD